MVKKKVFLSAGHGGKDSGAVGNGLKEKDINLNIMLACRDELVRHGVTVVTSRVKDENDPVYEEVKEANASKAHIAVSFHTNAGKGDGSESFYYPSDENGLRLAKLCEKHVKALGQNSRGVKSGKNLFFVNSTTMTAVLCECAFIDNKTDIKIIDTKAEAVKFGVAYAKAILEYFGIEYKEPTPNKATGSYKVKIKANALNVRAGAGLEYRVNTTVKKDGVYTIVGEKTADDIKWGKLKSGAGWISLGTKYVTKLK